MGCGVGHLDPELLWLCCRPAAVALIRPLALELPHAVGAALKSGGVGGEGRQKEK